MNILCIRFIWCIYSVKISRSSSKQSNKTWANARYSSSTVKGALAVPLFAHFLRCRTFHWTRCSLKNSNDIRPNKRFSCSTMNSYSLIIFAEICRHLIYADIPYICSRTSLAQFEGRSTNLITKGGRTKPAGGDVQLPGQLSAALSVAALCTWDQERNSNRKGGKSNRRWTKTEVEERERGETLKCAASVCRKLKLARATDASRRCTLQAEQVGREVYAYMCMGRMEDEWCGMGTTTTTAGVDGAWTARTFVMLDCAENQKQQQESGETKLAKRYTRTYGHTQYVAGSQSYSYVQQHVHVFIETGCLCNLITINF